ncbi:MAG: spermidine/putrescine ABC transporter substrate-binding protein [Gemmatimonadota bacterium]
MPQHDGKGIDPRLFEMLGGQMGRRQFLNQTAMAAMGASLLAACGGKDAARDAAKPAAGGASLTRNAGSGTREVRISNWPLYIDAATVADFQKATGITAIYTEDINDNNEFVAKIDEPLKRGQSIDRDIIVLTDWVAGRLISMGYAAPLDDSKFPNRVNIVDGVRNVSWDVGRKYSVPWLSGMTGIGYNPKKVGKEITSFNDIFDPKYKGKVTMLTEMRDTLGLTMLGMGKDPVNCTLDDAKAAAAKIKQARTDGQVRKFTGNDYAADLAAGNISIAMAWSGDIQGLAADNPDLRWIAPREGAMLFSDNMIIPRTSDRQDLAMAWINYCYDPAHSAQIVAGAPYLSDVKGAGAELAKIKPELAKSWLVNPPDELRSRLHVFRGLSDDEDKAFNQLFQDAIGA